MIYQQSSSLEDTSGRYVLGPQYSMLRLIYNIPTFLPFALLSRKQWKEIEEINIYPTTEIAEDVEILPSQQ